MHFEKFHFNFFFQKKFHLLKSFFSENNFEQVHEGTLFENETEKRRFRKWCLAEKKREDYLQRKAVYPFFFTHHFLLFTFSIEI